MAARGPCDRSQGAVCDGDTGHAEAVRIRFDPVSFAWFCRVQGILPDNQARAAWAASEAKERYDGKK